MGKRISSLRVAAGRRISLFAPRAIALSVAVCIAFLGSPARGQVQSEYVCPQPKVHWAFDIPMVTGSAALFTAGKIMGVTKKVVPPQGLDPTQIHWSVDRNNLGIISLKANRDSYYFRDAAIAYPVLLAFISQPSGDRMAGTFRHSLVYLETMLFSEGISEVIKSSVSRPRPYDYVPVSQRPKEKGYDVTAKEAFRSMPSGHATIAYCGASFAMVDHLISRPDASWLEHFGVGFVGGVLAETTAGTRTEAGQHFPSDTIVGALIGATGGIVMPVFHEYVGTRKCRLPWAPARAWLQVLAGEALGIGVGYMISEQY